MRTVHTDWVIELADSINLRLDDGRADVCLQRTEEAFVKDKASLVEVVGSVVRSFNVTAAASSKSEVRARKLEGIPSMLFEPLVCPQLAESSVRDGMKPAIGPPT